MASPQWQGAFCKDAVQGREGWLRAAACTPCLPRPLGSVPVMLHVEKEKDMGMRIRYFPCLSWGVGWASRIEDRGQRTEDRGPGGLERSRQGHDATMGVWLQCPGGVGSCGVVALWRVRNRLALLLASLQSDAVPMLFIATARHFTGPHNPTYGWCANETSTWLPEACT
jgi:hypothetical protein